MRTRIAFAAVLLAIFAATHSSGMFMMPTPIPAARLIKNAEEYIKEKPKDAQGYYILARIHYIAFRLDGNVGSMEQQNKKGLPFVAEEFLQPYGRPIKDRKETNEQRADHVRQAISNFHKALELSPDSGLYHLGLASLMEQAGEAAWYIGAVPGSMPAVNPPTAELKAKQDAEIETLVQQLGANEFSKREAAMQELAKKLPAAAEYLISHLPKAEEPLNRIKQLLQRHWQDAAAAEYKTAYDKSVAADKAVKNMPVMGVAGFVSHEAGEGYLRMMKLREKLSDDEKKSVEIVTADVAELKKKPIAMMTPIIVPLGAVTELADLVAPDAKVAFDLDGTKRPQMYNWIKPNAGLLVWDPEHTGKITSGHQLFGNFSFQLILTDGYRALDLLDDNRDGKLSGEELAGLALWQDRNGNGISDAGEVIAIEKTGIMDIAARATGKVGDTLTATNGVKLSTGRTLPTYDWLAESVSPK